MSFSVATWNILATAYIRPEYYPNTQRGCLDPKWRIPALVDRARSLEADLLCMQEVEEKVFEALRTGLAGYQGLLALKGGGRPDGCATFYRADRFDSVSSHRLAYADGSDKPASGHIAQMLTLKHSDRLLKVLNTHLKWDPPGTPREDQWGYRQVLLAIEALRQEHTPAGGQIICGDLNVVPGSDVVQALTNAGFDFAHRESKEVYTCNSNSEAKLIDYIFYRGVLRAQPQNPPPLSNHTPLPSPEQPSDHLPLLAEFDWI